MYGQAVGYSPGGRLLSGLGQKGSVAAFGKGQAMKAAADLGLERQKANQQLGVEQMQQQSQLRQQQNSNTARQAQNKLQERSAADDLAGRQRLFDVGMNFDYAQLQKRQQMNLRQALLNQAARDF